jgi:hypothetical protein
MLLLARVTHTYTCQVQTFLWRENLGLDMNVRRDLVFSEMRWKLEEFCF